MNRLGQIQRSSSGNDGIDIGPLIDIIFILLIFFMVSTTFVQNLEVPLERPSARSSQPSDTRSIRVALDRNNRVYLDGKPIAPWMVQHRVREILVTHPRRPVLVTADRNSGSGRLVRLVDQCRLAGAKHVAVETKDTP